MNPRSALLAASLWFGQAGCDDQELAPETGVEFTENAHTVAESSITMDVSDYERGERLRMMCVDEDLIAISECARATLTELKADLQKEQKILFSARAIDPLRPLESLRGDSLPIEKMVDDHIALALGDVTLEGIPLLDELAYEKLYYYARRGSISDVSKHPGNAIGTLIRQTNSDWNRRFTIPFDEDTFVTPRTLSLSLREIVKGFLTSAPAPSLDQKVQIFGESRLDEWTLLILAYAQTDSDLQTFLEKKGIHYEDWDTNKPRKTTTDRYVEGAQTELEEGQVDSFEATCGGSHAEEALLVHAVFSGNTDKTAILIEGVMKQLNALDRVDTLTFDEMQDLSHRLDTLSQVAHQVNFTNEHREIIRHAVYQLCHSLGRSLFQRDDTPTDLNPHYLVGLRGHSVVALEGLLKAGVLDEEMPGNF